MAFRTFKRSAKRFSRFPRRRKTRSEIAQLSVCRRPLSTGLASCGIPDQFFVPLVTGRDWRTPYFVDADPADSSALLNPAHDGKGVRVSGIEFDYFFSCIPEGSEEAPALGVTSIRYGLVVMELAPTSGSGGDAATRAAPQNPSANIFFHTEALRRDEDWGGGFNAVEELKKYRILWRAMWMQKQIILPAAVNDILNQSADTSPNFSLVSKHAKVRTGCTLNNNEGLFFVVEIVNPFLEQNPEVVLDLLGKCHISDVTRGFRYNT